MDRIFSVTEKFIPTDAPPRDFTALEVRYGSSYTHLRTCTPSAGPDLTLLGFRVVIVHVPIWIFIPIPALAVSTGRETLDESAAKTRQNL